MVIIITGATGFIGKALVEGWSRKQLDVIVVGRSERKIKNHYGERVRAITWDDLKRGDFDAYGIACVLNLAGAGIADKRWTVERKKIILESRISATDAVVEYCLRTQTPLLNASAVGIYGRQHIKGKDLPPPLDEDAATPRNHSKEFLPFVCHLWEEATLPLQKAGVRTVHLRFGVVLGKGGGVLKRMCAPFYFFAGGPLGSGRQPMSWISLVDACRAIDFIIENKALKGPVNLVSPQCVQQGNLARRLGKTLSRPSLLAAPGFMLRIALGHMADELLLNGQHVYPKRLLEHGFRFEHAEIDQALTEIFKTDLLPAKKT